MRPSAGPRSDTATSAISRMEIDLRSPQPTSAISKMKIDNRAPTARTSLHNLYDLEGEDRRQGLPPTSTISRVEIASVVYALRTSAQTTSTISRVEIGVNASVP